MTAFRAAEFVEREEAHNVSRDNVMFSSLQSIFPGQIVGVDSEGMFAAFNPSATDGTHKAAGISVYRVITTPGSTVKSSVISREAVIKGRHLTWPAGITTEQRAVATEQLRLLGITIS